MFVEIIVSVRGGVPLATVKFRRKSIARKNVTMSSKSTKIQTVITPDRK